MTNSLSITILSYFLNYASFFESTKPGLRISYYLMVVMSSFMLLMPRMNISMLRNLRTFSLLFMIASISCGVGMFSRIIYTKLPSLISRLRIIEISLAYMQANWSRLSLFLGISSNNTCLKPSKRPWLRAS